MQSASKSKTISLIALYGILTFFGPINKLMAQSPKDETPKEAAPKEQALKEEAQPSQLKKVVQLNKSEQLKKSAAEKPSSKKTTSDLEKKLNELDNLYVPIHWSDYITGLAIGGYDPLSYFISQKSEAGEERFQYLWHGVTWQFASEANLLAFKRTPSVYAPRYAGYDAYAISKGLLSEGLPSIWVIEAGKLYLFHNQVNRYLWQENRRKLSKKIEEKWQELSLDIPRFKVF